MYSKSSKKHMAAALMGFHALTLKYYKHFENLNRKCFKACIVILTNSLVDLLIMQLRCEIQQEAHGTDLTGFFSQ